MIHDNERRARARTYKKIVYIIGTYPDLTKTFIDREILQSKRAGLNLMVIAIRRSATSSFSKPVQQLVDEVAYLVPVSVFRFIRAHLYFLIKRFRKYVQTLVYLITREHPTHKSRVKTFLHFGLGITAADILRKTGSADHIHAHFADRAAVVTMVVSRLLDIPYSLTAHAFDIYRSPVFLKEKAEGAEFVTTCTAFNKAHLEKETGRPVELIYHGLDFATIRDIGATGGKAAPPMILSVGRLQEKKGFKYLVEACALLRSQGHEFRCEIVGAGPGESALSSLIGELDLGDHVTLCGALPNTEVLRKYSKASVFVLPCCVTKDGDRDGIPNVILEAMAFGLPVISTDISGVPEVIHHGETGILVRSRSAEDLGVAIAQVLEGPNEAATLGQSASEFVQREFDIRKNVGRMIELLTE